MLGHEHGGGTREGYIDNPVHGIGEFFFWQTGGYAGKGKGEEGRWGVSEIVGERENGGRGGINGGGKGEGRDTRMKSYSLSTFFPKNPGGFIRDVEIG